MYQINLTKKVVEDDIPNLKKSGINLEVLYKSLKKLETNPYGKSRSKSGDLDSVRGMDWGKGYRILFIIYDETQEVVILAIDSHDNAYRKVKRRI